MSLRSVGELGEDRAADYLLGLGYTIVTRRFKTKHGELDIVCLDGETLVFVEVKLRRAEGFSPEEAVGATKARRLIAAAGDFIAMHDEKRESRFDLIAIDRQGLRHHQNFIE